jgi:hypothetical protein
MPIAGYSLGDYVWEEKFKQMLPVAESGKAEAQYDVGEMYERGRGVAKDTGKAFNWYLKAAKQGHTRGAYRVGLAYLKGKGVGKNPEKAHTWLKKSADGGYERALFYLGEIYEKGLGVTQDYDNALTYYEKAQHGGFAPAVDRVVRVKDAIIEQERRARRLAEAAARRRAQKSAARKVSVNPPKLTTKKLLLKGGWQKRDKPAEFMPSDISKCKDNGRTLECMSSELKRNIGMADVVYRTKAVVYGMDDKGNFKISYRNKVVAVWVTDPNFAESGKEVPVKEGWQDAEHKLECKVEDNDNVTCVKDKIRTMKFKR